MTAYRPVLLAGSAPSGANQQPWQFVIIGDPALEKPLRAGAEAEAHDDVTTPRGQASDNPLPGAQSERQARGPG